MKKLLFLFAATSAVLFTSCEGDPGPPGPAGGLVYAQVFEFTVADYQYDATYNELYSTLFNMPVEVYESDAVLVYRLSGSDDSVNPPADVWTQLPQSIFYNDGTGDFFQYNFNFSFTSIQFTIEGNFPLTNIATNQRQNQTFRVAVVPAEFAATRPSLDDVMQLMESADNHVINIEP